jgi:hypothetical protein
MTINRWLLAAGMVAAMCLGSNSVQAQPQQDGNRQRFDPAQMMQRRMDSLKEQLEITDEAEWKAIQPLIQKVTEAQFASMRGMGRGMMGGPPRRTGDNAQGGDQAQGQRRGGFGGFGQPNPEAEALQKAVDAKASKAELKAALDKYQASRKAKQADLEKAQDELRKVLTTRQEAVLTLNGVL